MADEETVQVEDGASPVEEGTAAPTKKGRPKNMTEADFTKMFDARSQELVARSQAPLQRRISELEREKRRETDRADASWKFRDDPDEYKKWEEDAQRGQVREEFEAERAADKRQIAMLQMKVQYPNVPESAFGEATSPQDIEIAALKWERTNGAAPAAATDTSEDDETPPDAPGTLNGGGGASGGGLSDKQWSKLWGQENSPLLPTEENKARAVRIDLERSMNG
jgi:hypothetical protein